MTYIEAREKLKGLAKGRYFSLDMETGEYDTGKSFTRARGYIEKVDFTPYCHSFEAVITEMEKLILKSENPGTYNDEMLTGIPELDSQEVAA